MVLYINMGKINVSNVRCKHCGSNVRKTEPYGIFFECLNSNCAVNKIGVYLMPDKDVIFGKQKKGIIKL